MFLTFAANWIYHDLQSVAAPRVMSQIAKFCIFNVRAEALCTVSGGWAHYVSASRNDAVAHLLEPSELRYPRINELVEELHKREPLWWKEMIRAMITGCSWWFPQLFEGEVVCDIHIVGFWHSFWKCCKSYVASIWKLTTFTEWSCVSVVPRISTFLVTNAQFGSSKWDKFVTSQYHVGLIAVRKAWQRWV